VGSRIILPLVFWILVSFGFLVFTLACSECKREDYLNLPSCLDMPIDALSYTLPFLTIFPHHETHNPRHARRIGSPDSRHPNPNPPDTCRLLRSMGLRRHRRIHRIQRVSHLSSSFLFILLTPLHRTSGALPPQHQAPNVLASTAFPAQR